MDDAERRCASDMAWRNIRDLGDSLREYRASLSATAALSPAEIYRAASRKFAGLAAKAAGGDVDAMGALASAGQDFLSAAKENAASAIAYKRDVAMVGRAVDAAIAAADGGMSEAARQLVAQQQQVDLLTSIDGNIAILAGTGAAAPTLPSSAYVSPVNDNSGTTSLEAKIEWLAQRLEAPMASSAVSLKRLDDRTLAWDDSGFVRISTDGTPIEVTIDGDVDVVNGSTPFETVAA
jgi:hypothetical protein